MKKFIVVLAVVAMMSVGCNTSTTPVAPVSSSGVKKVEAEVRVGSNGMTTEQSNVKRRIEEDNKPGAIKHLYLISAYSGQVIFYSTVDGKVTSSSKRLTPTSVGSDGEPWSSTTSFEIAFGPDIKKTQEVIQDDGTYGSSMPYLYWWDTKGVYHQHYVTGGQIVHVSSQPIAVKSVIINMETVD